MKSLTALVPVFNEENTLFESLSRLVEINCIQKIIIIDDASTDSSIDIANDFLKKHSSIQLITSDKNCGKGKALSLAQNLIRTSHIVIHDADLEYYPSDLVDMFNNLENFDFVLGSRFKGTKERNNIYKRTYAANYIMSKVFSILYGVSVSDVATCYKMMPTWFFNSIEIESKGFEIEVELVAKYLNFHKSYTEVSINYSGRTYEEGKKIKSIDGIRYITKMFKLRYLSKS